MDYLSLNEIRDMMQSHGLRPDKSLGQHFLVDGNIVRLIIDEGGGSLALDIGAGPGVLTLPLSHRYSQVVAVEIDERLAPILAEVLDDRPNVEVIFADATAIEWEDVLGGEPVSVYGNLPYGVASPIMTHLFTSAVNWVRARFMLQREVAERLTAEPGTKAYGPLTLAVKYHADVTLFRRVSPGCFYPPPDVDSAIVDLTPRSQPPVSFSCFMQAVHAAFALRRKTLRNSLAGSRELPLERDDVQDVLEAAELDAGLRGEALEFEDFVRLALAIQAHPR